MRRDIEQKLRAHQVEPFKQLLGILASHQSAVDLSDTGTGKTYVAAAIAAANKLPTLVVCPKIVVSAWRRAAEHFGDELSVINYEMLQTGRSDFGTWSKCPNGLSNRDTYYVCQCCQQTVTIDSIHPCYTHPKGIHCIIRKKKPQVCGDFIFHSAVKFIIYDEVHRCGSVDSLNSDMLIAAKRQNIKVLGLSATAACNPLNMRALGYNLDLHSDKYERFVGPGEWMSNFYKWARGYGCQRDPAFHGFKWMVGADKQVEVMRDIRSSIIPARGVRVSVADIPGFPKREISAELYDVEKPEAIDSVYAALESLRQRASGDKAPESAITELLRARQRLELLKVPVASELALDYVDKGYSIGIFVNFRQTLDELAKRLPGAVAIYGGQREAERLWNIDHFQGDFARIIIVMSEAGGVGLSLPDLHGNFPRGGLVMPSDKAVTMRQIFGRFHRDDSVSNCFYRVLLAAGSIEQRMHRNLNQKFSNLDALNDGDLSPHAQN